LVIQRRFAIRVEWQMKIGDSSGSRERKVELGDDVVEGVGGVAGEFHLGEAHLSLQLL